MAESYSCEVDPHTLDDVYTTIRQLRNSRAPGEDAIPTEVYKACLESVGPRLHRGLPKFGNVRLPEITGVWPFLSPFSRRETSKYARIVEALALLMSLRRLLVSPSSKDSNSRGTSALALIIVGLGLDVDARNRSTTYVAQWSSVGASSKLLLCASSILLLRWISWTGTPYGGWWRRIECLPNSWGWSRRTTRQPSWRLGHVGVT